MQKIQKIQNFKNWYLLCVFRELTNQIPTFLHCNSKKDNVNSIYHFLKKI